MLLAGWTLGGAVQKTMDIYLTQYTFNEIERVGMTIFKLARYELMSLYTMSHTDVSVFG